jgi:hypothetical protein
MDHRDLDIANMEKRFVELWIDEHGRPPSYEMIVCPTCDGHGSHINPEIDRYGLQYEDLDIDQWEMYKNGTYNITCTECSGRNVVRSFTAEAEQTWNSWMQEAYTDMKIRMSESGGY